MLPDFWVRARTRLGQVRHRLLYSLGAHVEELEARVAELEARPLPPWSLEQLDRRYAPVLWQDVGRPPLPPLPPVLDWLVSATGPDRTAQIDLLRHRASDVGIGPAAEIVKRLDPERLFDLAVADSAPLPDVDDRVAYFGDDHIGFWLSGLADAMLIQDLAKRHGNDLAGGDVLDFGCASGRVLRHLPQLVPDAVGWGVDVSLAPLNWARLNLPTELRLIQGTLVPSLPLPDDSMDVVFAGSVFTHISEFEEAWLFELRRVLRPGGLALLSVHPERTWNSLGVPDPPWPAELLIRSRHRADPPGVEPVTLDLFSRPMPAGRVVLTDVEYPINNLVTFHAESWLRERWGKLFEFVEIIEHGHGAHQDLVVLRSPPDG